MELAVGEKWTEVKIRTWWKVIFKQNEGHLSQGLEKKKREMWVWMWGGLKDNGWGEVGPAEGDRRSGFETAEIEDLFPAFGV